jgi:hypothetical protein
MPLVPYLTEKVIKYPGQKFKGKTGGEEEWRYLLEKQVG